MGRDQTLIHGDITESVIQASIAVHRELGPGLLESAYEGCLHHELLKSGHRVKRQCSMPIVYDGIKIDCGYRLDMVVDDKVILELKSVQSLEPIHFAQLLTYLRLSGLRVGLLINFNVQQLKDGIIRRVL